MILDYRAYITVFVIGYALLCVSFVAVGHDRAWKLVFPTAITLLGASAFFGFLDWLWS